MWWQKMENHADHYSASCLDPEMKSVNHYTIQAPVMDEIYIYI